MILYLKKFNNSTNFNLLAYDYIIADYDNSKYITNKQKLILISNSKLQIEEVTPSYVLLASDSKEVFSYCITNGIRVVFFKDFSVYSKYKQYDYTSLFLPKILENYCNYILDNNLLSNDNYDDTLRDWLVNHNLLLGRGTLSLTDSFEKELWTGLLTNIKHHIYHIYDKNSFNLIYLFQMNQDFLFSRTPNSQFTEDVFYIKDGIPVLDLVRCTPYSNSKTTTRLVPQYGFTLLFKIGDFYSNRDVFENNIEDILNKSLIDCFDSEIKKDITVEEHDLRYKDKKFAGGLTFKDWFYRVGKIGLYTIYFDFKKEQDIFIKYCSDTHNQYCGITDFYNNSMDSLIELFLDNLQKELNNKARF